MFISLGLLSAPALGILQIRKKNLDLGLSIPFWAKFQPPIGELYRLELNINSFLQTWACSFMSCQFYLRSIKEATKEIGKI